MTDKPAARPGRLRLILALTAVVLIAAAALLYLNRKTLAREALTGWLSARGVPAEAEVYAIGPTTFAARLRIGDPARPDFSATRATVRYRRKGFGFEVVSVRLERPVLRASLRSGKVSVGSLDPLIEGFRRRPPRPDAARPRIEIDGGRLFLATDYGPVELTADARVEDNKLMSLRAASAPARLRAPDFAVDLGRSSLTVVTRGDRIDARLDAPVSQANFQGMSAERGRLMVRAGLPYPDLQRRRGDGAITLGAQLTAAKVSTAGQALDVAELQAAFVGRSAGWIPDLAVSGQATAAVRAEAGGARGARAEAIRIALASPDLTWTRAGGDRLSGTLRATAALEDARAADLSLRNLAAAFQGLFQLGHGGPRVSATGSLIGRGGYTGFGAPSAQDPPQLAAIKQAARAFRFAAPRLEFAMAPQAGPRARLLQPLTVTPEAGGTVRIDMPSRAAARLTASGGGLPDIRASLAHISLRQGAFAAALDLQARLSFAPVEHGQVDAAGRLRFADGALTFAATRCTVIKAEKLEFGENDVARFAGRLCPTEDPLLRVSAGGWRVAGRAQGASAEVPFLQARIEDAAGGLEMGQTNGRLHAVALVERSQVEDAAPETRFHPLQMTGRAELAREVWTADLDFSLPGGARVADAKLRHTVPSGQGGVDIDTGWLAFAPHGLQPGQISPLAAVIGPPAEGRAKFTGGFAWNPAAGISAGVLEIPGLDFQSPAGRVSGLSGKIVFTSLAPLVAAEGQVLSAERVEAAMPLTNVTATFGLRNEVLTIAGGSAEVGGGRVRLESLALPLIHGQPTRGVLVFEGVQLHDLVEASPFGQKVELDARVSGRVPFEAQGQRVRVTGGELRAVEPGRLSIDRSALTAVETDAQAQVSGPAAPLVAEPPPPSAFTDMAYQAMENLAFDKLEASINSRPDGRLGVLFHIVGRHDPPKKQEIRLGLMDLIRRRFMDKPLPLPSGTGVNLTLDTTLNLDDLLADYAAYQRLRSSGPVQP